MHPRQQEVRAGPTVPSASPVSAVTAPVSLHRPVRPSPLLPLLQAQTSVPRTSPQNHPSPAAHGLAVEHGLRGRAPGASPAETGGVLGPVTGRSGAGSGGPRGAWGSEEGGPALQEEAPRGSRCTEGRCSQR